MSHNPMNLQRHVTGIASHFTPFKNAEEQERREYELGA
jgi:hypothetical protein